MNRTIYAVVKANKIITMTEDYNEAWKSTQDNKATMCYREDGTVSHDIIGCENFNEFEGVLIEMGLYDPSQFAKVEEEESEEENEL